METTDLIAGIAEGSVVVLGSLPPHGRDLDLLVRPAEAEAIAAGLDEAGFESRGRVWARFERCRADVVELAEASTLRLGDAELAAIFEESRPIEPSGTVRRPAAHHALLILARRTMREGGRLREKRRARIAAELDEDSGAFAAAGARAPAWGATVALSALERSYSSGQPISLATRRMAVHEELRCSRSAVRARVGAWRAVLQRPRRGAVVSFSGLDGAGKSTQAGHLAEALDRLGIDAVVVWSSVAFLPSWLGATARATKRLLAAAARLAGRSPRASSSPGMPHRADDPGQALRSGSRILTFAWSMVVTVSLANEVVRRVWPQRLRGRVVVCDRHLLDAWAHLRFQYGEDRAYRLQLAILRQVLGRPRLAYLLDVSPETATARKPDYDVPQNARRAAIYRRGADELGVRALDGEQPMEDLCATVAREAWAELR